MAYEKRVAVLKQIGKGFSADGNGVSGAVYAERLGTRLTVRVQTASLAALKAGNYALIVEAGGQTFCFYLNDGEAVVEDAPSIKDGFSALLAFIKGDILPVAFGSCGAVTDYRVLLNALSEREKPVRPLPSPPIAPTGPNAPAVPVIPFPEKQPLKKGEGKQANAPFLTGAAYDDEAIAENDYFTQNLPQCDEDEAIAGGGEKGGEEAQGQGAQTQDECARHPFKSTEGTLTYYKKIREKLEAAFRKYPPDFSLTGVFPQSKWVKAEDAILGIVFQSGLPKYLCVAMLKDGKPPEEMRESCTFVPATPFDGDRGYYVVFQDADTGLPVTVSQS